VLVRAGRSASLRDQPNELTESRNEVVAMTLIRLSSALSSLATYQKTTKRGGVFVADAIATARMVSVSQTAEEAVVGFQAKETPAGTMHDGNQYVRADDLQDSRMGCATATQTQRKAKSNKEKWLLIGSRPGGPDDYCATGLDSRGAWARDDNLPSAD
jgi:hypothetical protein